MLIEKEKEKEGEREKFDALNVVAWQWIKSWQMQENR